MKYIDSMLFIYAAINNDERGRKARELVKKIRTGGERAVTSALTFDEVFWKIKKEKDFEQALKAGESFLKMNNLYFQEVNNSVLWRSYNFMKRYKLDPRDAIHVACALERELHTFVSEDGDFDKVEEVEREWEIE